MFFALMLAAQVLAEPAVPAEPLQNNESALQQIAEENAPVFIHPVNVKALEVNCYVEKETKKLVCPGAIAAYRSLYSGECCHLHSKNKQHHIRFGDKE